MVYFSLTTLGCKVNQYDSAALSQAMIGHGLTPMQPGQKAHLAVINTCCVTSMAMRKSRLEIRKAVRAARQNAAVLIVGCYGDFDRPRLVDLLADLDVDPSRIFIAGHHDNWGERIAAACVSASEPLLSSHDRAGANSQPANRNARGSDTDIRPRRTEALAARGSGTSTLAPIEQFAGHVRAFVKIQDGCDAFCAYCVVPYTRSRVWSRSIDEVESECRHLVEAGHKEIVLAGVFLGAFGRNSAIRRNWNGRPSLLPGLLRRLGRIEGLWRVRLSSLEPADADEALLSTCREMPNFAPHFHLPLQSGSARVLRRMNRQYTPDEFRAAVDRVRQAFDRPAITADVIVGFPSEQEEDFQATLELARYAGFSKIHAFAFSAIEGTAAWTYRHEAAPPPVVQERLARLSELEREMADGYRRQFIGREVDALVEAPDTRRPDERQALTDRHELVHFHGRVPPRQIVRLKITGINSGGLTGALRSEGRGA